MAMVASGDEGEDKSQWPPELAALERQFTSKYQHQLAQLVEEHALEIADIRADYDAKLSELVKEYSIKQAEEMPLTLVSTGDEDLDKIIRERDSLRNLAVTLRRVVQELARYLTSCEDELNKSIVGELLKLASPHITSTAHTSETSDSECEQEHVEVQKKVHFAPDVSTLVSLLEEDCLDISSIDVSLQLRAELESCLERLRGEAATVLGLTQGRVMSGVEDRRLTSLTRQLIEEKKAKEEANSQLCHLQELVNKYETELNEVHRELTETKDRMIKEKVAVETERQAERRDNKLSLLQEKARTLLSEKGDCPPQWLGLIEELCVEGDCLIEDAWRARDEQQLEVEAADKQLRSTRAFLDEQALEREQERDEYTREIARLNELVRERDQNWTCHKNYSTDVENLEHQLKETVELLRETEDKKVKVEKELKAAVDKIWVLRDIIGELETQVSSRSEREAALEGRLVELETELDTQTRRHVDTMSELQILQDCSGDHTEPQRADPCPLALRQVKSQLRGIAKSLEKHIRELEAVNIHVSTASLSSPSEDVSIREQLEALRCSTPEDKGPYTSCPPSPSHFPVEEFNHLSEKLLRYSRAAENIIKKLRDREVEIIMLKGNTEELQAERDVLQGQSERQQLQLATLNKRVEELRVRSERDMQANAAPLHQRILELEALNSDISNQLKDANRKLTKTKQKLDRSEALVLSHEAEISNLSQHQQELVTKLNQDLAAMRVEKQQLQAMVEKYRSEDSFSFPQLIEVMLAEKNADIDQLQERVEELMAQHNDVSKSQTKSRGYRVSFADDVTHFGLTEGERAREANHNFSNVKPFFSTPLSAIEDCSRIIPRVIGEEISKIPVPTDINLNSSPNRAVQLENVLSQLKSELEQKSQQLLECEAQLQELPVLEQELTKTKEELEDIVKSVGEDKRFYEEQLTILGETRKLLTKRERELKEVRVELEQREEDNVRTAADVKALQHIMEGLQQKLQEAKTFTQTSENSSSVSNELAEVKMCSDKYKEECSGLKSSIVKLEDQILSLEKALVNEKAITKSLQESIERLADEKENILSELNNTKSNCESLQVELNQVLSTSKENIDKIESLRADLEASFRENNNLNAKCEKLRMELEQLSKKQKVELKNILRKDSEEAKKLKEELESLKTSNFELESACEKLRQELNEVGNNLDLLRELNAKDDKIDELQVELNKLDQDKNALKDEKQKIEQSFKSEIAALQVLIEDLNKNLTTEEAESQESVKHKENLMRKYEVLKREYERLRRSRRECEKKCLVLKDELTKEKQFSARLQNGSVLRRVPQLQISKSNLVDIKPDGNKMTKSLDNLTDEVQKELDASAQLDQSLISGLQSNVECGVEVIRSDNMQPRVEYLSSRLAEAETALHVERVVVSELRARLVDEHRRLMEERARTLELREEVATLHTINDQFEDKFKSIAYQLEQQVNQVKDLRHNMMPTDANSLEKEKLKKLAEENQRKVDELVQERVFNKNQLLYLREELAKLQMEKDLDQRNYGHGDNQQRCTVDNLQQALECQTGELEKQQKKCAALQRMVEQMNVGSTKQSEQLAETVTLAQDLQYQIDLLKRQLIGEEKLRKSLEEKIRGMELTESCRLSRKRVAEEKLKKHLAEVEKAKKYLERECMELQLKLKQSQIQLTAHTAESPLSLRLREANVAVERLVKEKEDLNTSNALLKEEKQSLQKKLRDQDAVIEDLKSRIHCLNVKVTDGGLDNLNAMFAAERAAWLKEKEVLRQALTQTHNKAHTVNVDSINSYSNSSHFLERYLRAESHRKALVWQKRYLLVNLRSYQDKERQTIVTMIERLPTLPPPPPPTPEHRFKVAIHAVRAMFRMQYLVDHRKRSYENTCRLLQQALNSNKPYQHNGENVPQFQALWRKTDATTSSDSIQPGILSHYLDRFNLMQDRIKNTLSTAS